MTIDSHAPAGFSELDRHFAEFVIRLEGTGGTELWLAAALVSHLTQRGHVCLDLPRYAGKSLPTGSVDSSAEETLPELGCWLNALKRSTVVGEPGQFRPLILDEASRLYLYRYWQYEERLIEFLHKRTACPAEIPQLETLKGVLDRLFPSRRPEPDWQKIAALVSVLRKFVVVTGGPGTGKTSTVVKILILLLEQAGGNKVNIALAAPTGKAAARLKEAIKLAKETLDCRKEILALIPPEASTLHRLLGTIPNSTRFRHHRGNPLPYDAVVVDEASMVDLPLMAKLGDALKDESRLILLGDKDQLASVEPGAVFGDVCSGSRSSSFSHLFFRTVQSVLGEEIPEKAQAQPAGDLQDSIVVLDRSYRFGTECGIGVLSRMVNEGESENALQLLKEGGYEDLAYREINPHTGLEAALEARALEDYARYLRESDIEQAFALFSRFRILCALREGYTGFETINQLLEKLLVRHGLIRRRGPWYHGRPVLITENDYRLRVFNGDVGLALSDTPVASSPDEPLWVYLPSEDGRFRRSPPLRLPKHETAYAMTVHKSQGSEFDRVLLVLPTHPSEVLTRELIYTGITRSRKKLEIWGNGDVLKWAISRRIDRNSGLRDALWPNLAAQGNVRK